MSERECSLHIVCVSDSRYTPLLIQFCMSERVCSLHIVCVSDSRYTPLLIRELSWYNTHHKPGNTQTKYVTVLYTMGHIGEPKEDFDSS